MVITRASIETYITCILKQNICVECLTIAFKTKKFLLEYLLEIISKYLKAYNIPQCHGKQSKVWKCFKDILFVPNII